MLWALEELTEDAIVAYLKAGVNDELAVYASWDFASVTYPCAIVHASTTEPVSEPAEWHDARMLSVLVSVVCEAVAETDDDGNEIVSARQRNINVRSKVLDLLCVADLNDQLVAQEIADVAFSMAQTTTTERSVEDDPRRLITTITVEVIAEPVTGS